MKLAYAYPEHLGRPAARLLQSAATVKALASQAEAVHLLAGRFRGLPARLAELGLDTQPGLRLEPLPMWQAGPGKSLPFSWHWPFHAACLRRLRALAGHGVSWVMVRHLKLADYLLERGLPPGMRLAFEAHELFSLTAQEEGAAADKVAQLAQMERRVFSGADLVLAVSAPLAQALDKLGCLRAPALAVPNGVAEEFFALPQDQRQSGLLVYAGGLADWKGVDTMLKALALVPQARLEILGGRENSPDWQRISELAARLGLGQRLSMRPQASQARVRQLLARGALAIWPGSGRQRQAAEFTSPLKLFEYLASGCPVVAPDLPSARAIVNPGEHALLFQPDNAPDLARAMGALLADPELARRLGRAGRELARGFTWQARAQRILQAMDEAGA